MQYQAGSVSHERPHFQRSNCAPTQGVVRTRYRAHWQRPQRDCSRGTVPSRTRFEASGATLSTRWKRKLAACVAVLLASGATPAFAGAADEYNGLPGKKALAVAEGASPVYGMAHSQAQDIAASHLALQDCEEKRAASSSPCELIRLNEVRITSARELREALPAGPRPLYLWRYTSPGATVFLAGSIHFLKESLYPLPEPFEAAFRQADTLVVEVDLSALTPAEMQSKTIAAGRLPKGETLATVLPPELYARLSRRFAGDGMDIVLFESLKPAMVMNQLAVFGLMALGYSPQFGLEQHFTASKGDRPVLELESIDAQLDLLFGQPIATQVQLLEDTLDQEEQFEPLLADMVRAWLAGADDAFLDLFEQQVGQSELARTFNRKLLDDRNAGMAESIAGYLSGTGTYFVLVGAAHFIGENGIVSLLAQKGINGTRILSDTEL